MRGRPRPLAFSRFGAGRSLGVCFGGAGGARSEEGGLLLPPNSKRCRRGLCRRCSCSFATSPARHRRGERGDLVAGITKLCASPPSFSLLLDQVGTCADRNAKRGGGGGAQTHGRAHTCRLRAPPFLSSQRARVVCGPPKTITGVGGGESILCNDLLQGGSRAPPPRFRPLFLPPPPASD